MKMNICSLLRKLTFGLLLTFFCLISGCVTTPPIPGELQYAPPQAGAAVASIKGSATGKGLLPHRAFVLSIDGKRVMAGLDGWSIPIPIALGEHSIAVEFARGGYSARTDLLLKATAGSNYEVKFTSDLQTFGNKSYVDFWISDEATRKPVTVIQRASMQVSRPRNPYIPIFIPAG